MGKTILYILLALSVGVFGFTIGRYTDVLNVGGETFRNGKIVPSLGSLSDPERQVAKSIIQSSDAISKKFVGAVGEAAKDEKKFAKVMESFEKDPLRTLSIAARSPQREPEEDPNKVWTFETGDVPTKGPADAPITIVEFSDFQCPFCSKGHATMKELEAKYPGKIKFQYVSKMLPFHQKAPAAHAAAYAAWKQNKFWEFNDLAFANQKDLTEEKYLEWAKSLGLDLVKFKTDMALENYKAEFDRMEKLSNDLGVRGTPTFFVNGRKIRGARPIDAFTSVIDELLKTQG